MQTKKTKIQTPLPYSTEELLSLTIRAQTLVNTLYSVVFELHLGLDYIEDCKELDKLYNAIRLVEHFRLAHSISRRNDHLELIFY